MNNYQAKLRSEVFLREDLEAILRAVVYSQNRLADHVAEADVSQYLDGFSAALEAIAIALHIDLPSGDPGSVGASPMRVISLPVEQNSDTALEPFSRIGSLGSRTSVSSGRTG